ncbi:HD-GYP domain-containing protein [Vibrio sp. TBV020]|uniref:HD-GYP domain-containing protein n=1 Tax=Vibrio sp. TBV020 TaxID=3137398 RepID=UPI0038CD301F
MPFKLRVFTWLVLSALFSGSLYAEENANHTNELTKEIAMLVSTSVYNLDTKQIRQILTAKMKVHPEILFIKVEDSALKRPLALLGRNKQNHVVNVDRIDAPQAARFSSAVNYDDKPIGTLTVYTSQNVITNAPRDSLNYWVISVLFIIFVVLLVGIYRIVTTSQGHLGHLAFGTKRFAQFVICGLVIFVTLTFSATYMLLAYNKQSILDSGRDTLLQYVTSYSSTLRNVSEIRSATFAHIFAKNEFQRCLFKLLSAIEDANDDQIQSYSDKMTNLWFRYRELGYSPSKTIISPKGQFLYQHGQPIDIEELFKVYPELLNRALNGQSQLIPVVSKQATKLIFATPIHDNALDQIVAIALIEMELDKSELDDLSRFHFGLTGEISVFTSEGIRISQKQHLPKHPKLDARDLDTLSTHIRKSSSPTSSELLELYDDRGDKIYAVLFVEPSVDAVLVAKVSKTELLEDYYRFRTGLLSIVIAMLIFTVPSLLFTLYAGNLSNASLKTSRKEIISKLGHAAEFKDNETALHIVRMSRYTEILARNSGQPDSWVELIGTAAPMHDIGKIGVPDAILKKPGKLDADEWKVMQQHPCFGAEILGNTEGSELLSVAKEIALFHHEKWDGSGYPFGLKSTDIPFSARIVAIADVFDALTSERPYKKAWPFDQAVSHIVGQSEIHFDPDLIRTFVDSLTEFKLVMVKFSDEPTDGS